MKIEIYNPSETDMYSHRVITITFEEGDTEEQIKCLPFEDEYLMKVIKREFDKNDGYYKFDHHIAKSDYSGTNWIVEFYNKRK